MRQKSVSSKLIGLEPWLLGVEGLLRGALCLVMHIEKNKGVESYDVTGSSEGVLQGSIHKTMGLFRVRTGPGRGLRTYVKCLYHVIN